MKIQKSNIFFAFLVFLLSFLLFTECQKKPQKFKIDAFDNFIFDDKEIKEIEVKKETKPSFIFIDTSKKNNGNKIAIKIKPLSIEVQKLTTKGLIVETYKKPFLSTVKIDTTGKVQVRKYKALKIAVISAIILATTFFIVKGKKRLDF